MDVVVPRCARIQLGSGQKVNRAGTRAASIPVEWLLIEFA
jgi:hypothetical protein